MKSAPEPQPLDPVMKVTWWRDALTEEHGFPMIGEYVEKFWLPVVGPSAMWLARKLVCLMPGSAGVDREVDMEALATSIGIQPGLYVNAPATKSIYRLIRFGMARREDDTIDIRSHVGHVPPALARRFPEALRVEVEARRLERALATK